MITLQIDRSRFAFVAVQRASRDAWDFLIGNDGYSIGHDRYHSSYQRDFISLPLIWSQVGDFTWRQETIHASIKDIRRVGVFRAILDLNFVSASQINACVTSFRKPKPDF